MINRLLIIITLILAFSCTNNSSVEKSDDSQDISDTSKTEVSIVIAKKQLYSSEIVSNGKLSARNKSDLYFKTVEKIDKIFVKNGDKVQKGKLLAQLSNFELKNKLSQAELGFEQSKITLSDFLIGQGFASADTSLIPKVILANARIKSGFTRSQTELEMALYSFENSMLYAPFDGVVANLWLKEYNYCKTGEAFCSIIDNSVFEIDFPVLESELSKINVGYQIKAVPYFAEGESYKGVVIAINEVIDKNGLAIIRAQITNNAKLSEGMNMKIFIELPSKKALVIPKEAITLRTERKVVFTYKNGVSYWNYVTTSDENSASVVVTEGINENDTVIVSGNLHLAHESPVQLKQ